MANTVAHQLPMTWRMLEKKIAAMPDTEKDKPVEFYSFERDEKTAQDQPKEQ